MSVTFWKTDFLVPAGRDKLGMEGIGGWRRTFTSDGRRRDCVALAGCGEEGWIRDVELIEEAVKELRKY